MAGIAILTSGGDCSGMNAVVYYCAKYAKKMRLPIYGVINGLRGLLNDEMEELDVRELKEFVHCGGTILGTARVKNFIEEEVQKKAYENLVKRDIDTLIVCGGEGSFAAAHALSKHGLRVYGIPCTIDNDIFYTDFTIGFSSCVEMDRFCYQAIKDTTFSHSRVHIIETMGRRCGDIALYTGLSCGADVVLIPEVKWDLEDVVKRLSETVNEQKQYGMIVMSEGCSMHCEELRKKLEEVTNYDIRTTNLGHIQRGGHTSKDDDTLANLYASRVFKLLKEKVYNKCVGMSNEQIIDIDIDTVKNYTTHPAYAKLHKLVDLKNQEGE